MAPIPLSRSIFIFPQTGLRQNPARFRLPLSRTITSTRSPLTPEPSSHQQSQLEDIPEALEDVEELSTFHAAAPPARIRKNATQRYSTETETILPPSQRPNQPFSAVAPFLSRTIPSGTPAPASPRSAPQPLPTSTSTTSQTQTQATDFKFPPLPYHVHRTISQQLPIYHVTRGGGTKKLTQIRRITGNANKLRDQLEEALPPSKTGKKAGVSVNPLTGHVWVKGWKKGEVAQFLRGQYF